MSFPKKTPARERLLRQADCQQITKPITKPITKLITKPPHEPSQSPMKKNIILTPDYATFVADLKSRIAGARLTAARTVNRELILLYWDIGKAIVEKQRVAKWGDSVVQQLAADLCRAFPDVRGFSAQNIWRMQQLYQRFTSPEFLSQAAREMGKIPDDVPQTEFLSQAVREMAASIPWGHFANLLSRITRPAPLFYYLRATARLGWSRNVLLNQIKAGAYERARVEKKTHNFALALPEHFAEQAEEALKSRYNLEFLGISREVKERELENRLTDRLRQFILELGYGFCFIGQQYRLTLGNKEYFVDLLFYHRFLKALVAFDLKVGAFEPEHAGKMDFYLNLLNDRERAPDDRPSIGIILCAEKDEVEVEFALKTKTNPIGVAKYQLQAKLPPEFKGRLPTARQLTDAVREIQRT
ncbi:MAG: PDDEXK nuclease domain-containing protein [Opitutaceae bacterium]|jgi:predicted nuclease of restriction endonuclease-like (RecB) superfamily|nr:PDDEXK nuclease domain-containing protein [Opitutaceae bacterium]